jgi:hypothetical protein
VRRAADPAGQCLSPLPYSGQPAACGGCQQGQDAEHHQKVQTNATPLGNRAFWGMLHLSHPRRGEQSGLSYLFAGLAQIHHGQMRSSFSAILRLLGRLRQVPVQNNGPAGTGRDAGVATIAPARINERRFPRIDLPDRLVAAQVTGQALATCPTSLIYHAGNGRSLGLGRFKYRHGSLSPLSGRSEHPLYTPQGY